MKLTFKDYKNQPEDVRYRLVKVKTSTEKFYTLPEYLDQFEIIELNLRCYSKHLNTLNLKKIESLKIGGITSKELDYEFRVFKPDIQKHLHLLKEEEIMDVERGTSIDEYKDDLFYLYQNEKGFNNVQPLQGVDFFGIKKLKLGYNFNWCLNGVDFGSINELLFYYEYKTSLINVDFCSGETGIKTILLPELFDFKSDKTEIYDINFGNVENLIFYECLFIIKNTKNLRKIKKMHFINVNMYTEETRKIHSDKIISIGHFK